MKIVKTIKLKVKKEHLRCADFQNITDCPVARALKSEGYQVIGVGGIFARVMIKGREVTYDFTADGGLIYIKILRGKPFSMRLRLREIA